MDDKEQTYIGEVCKLRHQLIEQRIDAVEEKVTGIEKRLTEMSEKIDKIMGWQENQYKLQIGLLVAIILTLVGVFVGRGFDFGIFS